MTLTFVLLAVVIGIIFVFITMYNRLVRMREEYKNAFTQINIQIKRRYDLIPNLVEVAKGYLKHEKETLENVIKARQQAVSAREIASNNPNAGNLQQLTSADQVLTQGLGRLMMISESYPDLKADQQMKELSQEIESTESRIAFARQAYNDSVMDFNATLGAFPYNIIGGIFGFIPAVLLEAITNQEEKAPIKVSF
jgi:LemA protein